MLSYIGIQNGEKDDYIHTEVTCACKYHMFETTHVLYRKGLALRQRD